MQKATSAAQIAADQLELGFKNRLLEISKLSRPYIKNAAKNNTVEFELLISSTCSLI